MQYFTSSSKINAEETSNIYDNKLFLAQNLRDYKKNYLDNFNSMRFAGNNKAKNLMYAKMGIIKFTQHDGCHNSKWTYYFYKMEYMPAVAWSRSQIH